VRGGQSLSRSWAQCKDLATLANIPGRSQGDGDPPKLANRLSVEEEQKIRTLFHQPEYASLLPSQIVQRLADRGIYLASASTFYRGLRRYGEVHHRDRCLKPSRAKPPTTFTASVPCQVLSWGCLQWYGAVGITKDTVTWDRLCDAATEAYRIG